MTSAFDPTTARQNETLDSLAADVSALLDRMGALVHAACPGHCGVIVTAESYTKGDGSASGFNRGSVAVFMPPTTEERLAGLMHHAPVGPDGYGAALAHVIGSIAELKGDE